MFEDTEGKLGLNSTISIQGNSYLLIYLFLIKLEKAIK